jgi:hypothetical protein
MAKTTTPPTKQPQPQRLDTAIDEALVAALKAVASHSHLILEATTTYDKGDQKRTKRNLLKSPKSL